MMKNDERTDICDSKVAFTTENRMSFFFTFSFSIWFHKDPTTFRFGDLSSIFTLNSKSAVLAPMLILSSLMLQMHYFAEEYLN